MPRTFADMIAETSQTLGTGAYDLDGAVDSNRAFRQAYGDGDAPSYMVVNRLETKWEKNRGGVLTLGTPDRLSRDVVLSTNGNAPVSWTAEDRPLTIYVPRDSDVDEGVITGWLAAARHALLKAGARWWKSSSSDMIDTLYTGAVDVRIGIYRAAKGFYFGDGRRPFTAVGANNKVLAVTDVGGRFSADNAAANRTFTLPPIATAGEGYHVDVIGLSAARSIILAVDAGDTTVPIDFGSAGVSRTLPGQLPASVWSDGTQWRTNYIAPTATVYPAGTITGLTYSNNGTDATNDIDIAAGAAMDATGAYWMALAATLTKRLDAAWAVGSGNGGLDTGSIADTDYYIWLIARSDTGVVDALFSTSATAPTMPADYDYKRLFGWFKRVSSTIVAFTTWEMAGGGLALRWTTPTLDINDSNTLTTSRQLNAVKAPLNFSTDALVRVSIVDAASEFKVLICSPGEANAAVSDTAAPLANLNRNAGGTSAQGEFTIRTDSSGRIAARSTTGTVDTYAVVTIGFNWSRR